MSRFKKKYILLNIYSGIAFFVISLGMTLVGAGIEEVIDGSFNLDWMGLYNSIYMDSGSTIVFVTSYIFILFMISTEVLYLVYKGNKNLAE
jgi:hypothetical protein